MRTSEGLKIAKELVGYGVKMLALEVVDVMNKHWRDEKLTKQEVFLAGLRYSEFYAEDTTDNGYCIAYEKQEQYFKVLGISKDEFYKVFDELIK